MPAEPTGGIGGAGGVGDRTGERAGERAAAGPAGPAGPAVTYAYLIQVSRDGVTWVADRAEPSGGIEISPLPPTEVARSMLGRRFVQLRADDSAHWDDHWFRVDVWSVGRMRTDGADGLAEVPANWALSGRHLQTRGIAPDVVEVRTPSQVRRSIRSS